MDMRTWWLVSAETGSLSGSLTGAGALLGMPAVSRGRRCRRPYARR